MNFDAHPTRYQHQIIRAYQGLDAVTTLTDSDQFAYQQRIQTPVYIVPILLIIVSLEPKTKHHY